MPVIGDDVGLTLDSILVATDFTPPSQVATAYARALAKHFASRVTLAHVVDLSATLRSQTTIAGLPLDELRRETAESMEGALYEFSRSGVIAQGHTLEARNTAAAIVSLSEQTNPQLLIIGTHSRTRLAKLLTGGCAEEIIRHSRVPVMTIGPKVQLPTGNGFSFETIVFATDLRHDTAEKAGIVLEFAKDSVARVILCHVLEDVPNDLIDTIQLQTECLAGLCKLIPDATYEWCSPECVVKYGSVATQILKTATATKTDLIVLGARRSTSWFAHLTEGVVGHVLEEAMCPVLTICTD